MRIASLTAAARHLDFVRETLGPNRGAWVQKFQRDNGGAIGESWCADFLCFVLDLAYAGRPPIILSPSCQVMLDDARRLKLEVPQPEFDDLFFVLDDVGHAHHCGIVTSENPLKIWPYVPLTGIAGNTSVDGTSSDGIGVFEHTIGGRLAFVRLPEP